MTLRRGEEAHFIRDGEAWTGEVLFVDNDHVALVTRPPMGEQRIVERIIRHVDDVYEHYIELPEDKR